MTGVHRWTGRETTVLRQASRLTVRAFAELLGVSDRMVSRWEAGGTGVVPRPDTQAMLDTALARADDATRDRFDALRGTVTVGGLPRVRSGASTAGEVTLAGEDSRWSASMPPEAVEVPAVVDVVEAAELAAHAHRCYQETRYRELTAMLSPLSRAVEALAAEAPDRQQLEVYRLRASVEAVAAKLATKLGQGEVAWEAARRAHEAAQLADDRHAAASAVYQTACAALKLGRRDRAEEFAVRGADAVVGGDAASVSWCGALTLLAAIIAARRRDEAEAHDRLDRAQRLAERLGGDGNIGWSAFGPTNVQIHRMSAAVELDDPQFTLTVADRLEVAAIPAQLRGRQAQVRLNSAWASAQLHEDSLALLNLLDAERVAPELVRNTPAARALVGELHSRPRRHALPGLHGLAKRAGLVGA